MSKNSSKCEEQMPAWLSKFIIIMTKDMMKLQTALFL